ncbi:MAG: phospholipid carrier-dependent glycosyltransferase [Candidatus Brocadiaceae bacterium]|jgi:hypothetical protein
MQSDTRHKRPAEPVHGLPGFRTPGRLFLLVLAVVALLHAAALNGHWWYQRDSALYMSLARSLAETGTYTFNGLPHAFVLPGLPMMLAPIYAAFGESLLAMNALMALFGVGCVALAYPFFREACPEGRHSTVCILLFGLSFALFYYSRRILTDVPFTFFSLATLLAGLRMVRTEGRASYLWAVAAGLAVACASAVRPLGPALMCALMAGIWLRPGWWRTWRRGVAQTLLALAPTLVLLAFWMLRSAALHTPSPTYTAVFLKGKTVVEMTTRILGNLPEALETVFKVVTGGDLDALGGVLLGVPVLAAVAASLRRGERLLIAFALVYGAGISIGSPSRRLMLPLAPVLLAWLVEGGPLLAGWIGTRARWASPRLLRCIGYAVLAAILLGNLARISEVVYRARASRFYSAIEKRKLSDYRELSDWLKENASSDGVVLVHEHRLVHYWTRLTAWRFRSRWLRLSREGVVAELQHMGVSYLVRDPDGEEYRAIIDRIMHSRPEAFERIRTFGNLEVFSVDAPRLSAPGPSAQRSRDGLPQSPSNSRRHSGGTRVESTVTGPARHIRTPRASASPASTQRTAGRAQCRAPTRLADSGEMDRCTNCLPRRRRPRARI